MDKLPKDILSLMEKALQEEDLERLDELCANALAGIREAKKSKNKVLEAEYQRACQKVILAKAPLQKRKAY